MNVTPQFKNEITIGGLVSIIGFLITIFGGAIEYGRLTEKVDDLSTNLSRMSAYVTAEQTDLQKSIDNTRADLNDQIKEVRNTEHADYVDVNQRMGRGH